MEIFPVEASLKCELRVWNSC